MTARWAGLTPLLALILGWTLGSQERGGARLGFDRYHDSRQTAAALARLARRYPGFLRVEVIGKTARGTEIHAATVTDFAAGQPDEKPGIFVEGNIHGNERVGGEAALYLVQRLVTGARQDPKLEDLVRTRTFFIVPKLNPDGADLWIRGIPAPDDEDGDGREDEDGPDDVDGDGLITGMRIEDPAGEYIPAKDGRLMVRWTSLTVKERKRYRGPRYRVLREGLDNDGDGEVNEDGPDWRIDPNRDFPADLKMERRYRKKYARSGSTRTRGRPAKVRRGKARRREFLRTDEVRAAVKFLEAHRGIALAVSYHSYGNVLFRPFGYLPDRPIIPREDLERLDALGDLFRRTTGFKGYGAPYLGKRQVVGGLHDYTYWSLGYPGLTAEIWGVPGVGPDWATRGQRPTRQQRRQRRRQAALTNARKMLDYIDREKIGDVVVPWQPFEHPTLGRVEIGGLWDPWRLQYNPPPSRLEPTIRPFVEFTLEAARMTPLVRLMNITTRQTTARVHRLDIEVMNVGSAPTAWKLAEKRKVAKPVTLHLELPPGARLTAGRPERVLGRLRPGQAAAVRWNVVAPEAGRPFTVTVVARSEKGGVHRRTVKLVPRPDTH